MACKPVKSCSVETPDHIAALRVVGGDLALDFANTVDGGPGGGTGFDRLRGYGDLVAWGLRVGFVSEDGADVLIREARRRPEEAEAVYGRALELRGAIYGIFRAVADRERPASDGVEVLRRAESEGLSRAELVRGEDGFRWGWTDGGDLAGVVWPVAHAAAGLLTSNRLARLKRCAGCRWLFVDTSKNRGRRWCTMEDCGTQEKVRRYVAKRAARRKAT